MKKYFFYIFIYFLISFVSASHYIVGIVNNARDGTSANGHTVVLWNPTNGINDNVTDIIGTSGNSLSNNIYMIDCELLNQSCRIGNTLYLKVINMGDGHFSTNISVVVTGAGYDIASNITLSSLLNFTSVTVDDNIPSPINEIDLLSGSNQTVSCNAIISDLDGIGVKNASARFFDITSSSLLEADSGNKHYTNSSCFINSSYGINQSQILCNFLVTYYANTSNWNCTITATDNNNISNNGSAFTFINPLLSIEVNNTIDFGTVSPLSVSSEKTINVTNYGNVKLNLSLYGYGASVGDGFSMNCSNGRNISINYEKYNLSLSTAGNLTLSQFQNYYINLSSSAVVKRFNLNFRNNDSFNFAVNSTFWRIYVPSGIFGSCSGNIVFGASQATGN